jgi:hypothetical protein
MLKRILKFVSLVNDPNKNFYSMEQVEEMELNSYFNGDLNNNENKNNFRKWVHSYLNNSENLTEKKYKLIFISIYMRKHHHYIDNILDKEDTLITDISKEIIENNESKFNIDSLFNKNPFNEINVYLINTKTRSISIEDIVNEDQNNPEKLAIAQKIYNSFAKIGILGEAIMNNWESTQYLLEMQNFKLNNADIKKFEEQLAKTKYDNNGLMLNISRFPVYRNIDNLTKLIINEDDTEVLSMLKQFYFNNTYTARMEYDPFNYQEKAIEINQAIQDALNTKIEYLEIKNETTPTSTEPKNIKHKKIKI